MKAHPFAGLVAAVAAAAAAAAFSPALAQDAPAEAAHAAPVDPAAMAPETPEVLAPDAMQAPVASEPATPAAPAASTGKLAPPAAGMGQVVFFRPGRLMGAALSFTVHEGQTGVGKLGNGSYFVVEAAPGEHTFTIQSEAKDSLTLEVEAGETYYVEQTIGMGIMMGRPHLAPAEQAAFDAKKLKLSTKKPTDLNSAD